MFSALPLCVFLLLSSLLGVDSLGVKKHGLIFLTWVTKFLSFIYFFTFPRSYVGGGFWF